MGSGSSQDPPLMPPPPFLPSPPPQVQIDRYVGMAREQTKALIAK